MIKPITFPNQKVTAAAHGAIFHSCLSDGIISGCALSYSGSTLYLGTGFFVAAGRLLEVVSTESIATTRNAGYARVKGVIDTSQISSETDFRQFSFIVDYASSATGFPALSQGDVNSGGTLYEFEVCVMGLGAAGITGIARRFTSARAKAGSLTLSLPASGWSGSNQTVAAVGITATAVVICSPAPASWTVARDNGLRCTGQGEGTLTFTCDSVPTVAVSYNAAVFN